MRCVGLRPTFLKVASPESSSIDILDQLCWSLNKEKDCLRDCVAETVGGPFSRVAQAG